MLIPLHDLTIRWRIYISAVTRDSRWQWDQDQNASWPLTRLDTVLIFCPYISEKRDQPPKTMYLLTAPDPERTPYLSCSPIRGRNGAEVPILEDRLTCAIKLRLSSAQTVAVTGSDACKFEQPDARLGFSC
ncbi:hypothetical protein LshimejAT787_1103630 [Lyophyllum shimeji]|uniref:Uncharacterized protein n=1 Tax=Lyophyllum shimeji TaxID=47721 RepID=A0A9P3PVI0_LYOSH|nr:hypothetical protein LshimejAT787_1103630 [Lyophyllum shimeji]